MTELADRLNVSTPVSILIGLVTVIQFGLAIYALLDLARRDRVAGGRKWVWVILILIGNIAGSALYLAVGRNAPPVVAEQPVSHLDVSLSHAERIRRGVDALYGPVE